MWLNVKTKVSNEIQAQDDVLGKYDILRAITFINSQHYISGMSDTQQP
jgi:hypothetical protein